MEVSTTNIASLLDLPRDILPIVLNYLPLHSFVQCRRVCKTFQKVIAGIAPVEKIPSLLLKENYENLPNLYIEAPVMSNLTASAAFAGKMKDAVWSSPLVQWLHARGELNLLPWREILLFRVTELQRESEAETEYLVTSAEQIEQPGCTAPQILLPTKVKWSFNLHTWRKAMMNFVERERNGKGQWDRSWPQMVSDAKKLEAGETVILDEGQDGEEELEEKTELELFDRWVLDVNRWIHGKAAPQSSNEPKRVVQIVGYNFDTYSSPPGIFFGDWMSYPIQLANVFAVFFYYES